MSKAKVVTMDEARLHAAIKERGKQLVETVQQKIAVMDELCNCQGDLAAERMMHAAAQERIRELETELLDANAAIAERGAHEQKAELGALDAATLKGAGDGAEGSGAGVENGAVRH